MVLEASVLRCKDHDPAEFSRAENEPTRLSLTLKLSSIPLVRSSGADLRLSSPMQRIEYGQTYKED